MPDTPNTALDTLTLDIVQPGKRVETVNVPFGTTVAQLSDRLGFKEADSMKVMDDNGNILEPDQPITTNTSLSYLYNLAGAQA